MKLFKILAFWCFILCTTAGIQQVHAQPAQTTTVEQDIAMADVMRQDGKIYVVVAVIVTMLAGVLVYLVALDRKVGKLEKQAKDGNFNR